MSNALMALVIQETETKCKTLKILKVHISEDQNQILLNDIIVEHHVTETF